MDVWLLPEEKKWMAQELEKRFLQWESGVGVGGQYASDILSP